jgi:hypothetical protein
VQDWIKSMVNSASYGDLSVYRSPQTSILKRIFTAWTAEVNTSKASFGTRFLLEMALEEVKLGVFIESMSKAKRESYRKKNETSVSQFSRSDEEVLEEFLLSKGTV